jgi:alginate O-acetyltransferase complex protein AlgI
MLFPTLDFLLFFIVVAAAMAALPRHEARKAFLVAASYFFYAQWNWRFCFLLAGSSAVTFLGGLALERAPQTWKRPVVGVVVAIHLALLGTFKYFDFFVGSLNALAHRLGLAHELPFLEIVLPVGISFFTFHGISYIVDVYRGDAKLCRSPLDMLLYISFFPQLVAGPIVRAAFFLPQLAGPARGPIELSRPLMLILGGLFKKVVVANYLATDLVDKVFIDPGGFPTADLVFAAYGYAVQIYCDFSAYSDIAIGLATLLGYRFPVNFNQPYRAQSLREFWQRWHISLSTWLRDYLYKPLGGNRGGTWRTARNLIVTMLLGGIWHGAAWKFVFWGALHGGGLQVERMLGGTTGWAKSALGKALATILVFHFVCLGWIFFRADSFDGARLFLSSLAALTPGVVALTPFTLGLVVLGMALHFVPPDLPARLGRLTLRWPAWALGAAGGVAAAAIDALGPDGVAPFIYFQF